MMHSEAEHSSLVPPTAVQAWRQALVEAQSVLKRAEYSASLPLKLALRTRCAKLEALSLVQVSGQAGHSRECPQPSETCPPHAPSAAQLRGTHEPSPEPPASPAV